MWLQRFSSYLVVCGFMLLILVVGALFLKIGAPFLSFGSAVLGICLIFFLLIIYFWPIAGIVVSWKIMGLLHQPEKKPITRVWSGCALSMAWELSVASIDIHHWAIGSFLAIALG
ncbi:hypothetical protein [Herpetosiphon llansteffanensis]|uniref:hypothetical protein n=1 Tax=Herpetosiphon llansteffanensis TaxID=2094568 RepID=UPI000F51A064|nr:hypothetical protein [Herpetosiphon llansteffanensis]